MKNKHKYISYAMPLKKGLGTFLLTLALTGCFQDGGTTIFGGGKDLPPPDFNVPQDGGSTDVPPLDVDPISVDPNEPDISLQLLSPSLTPSQTVRLKAQYGWRMYMRVGFDQDCNNGPWVPVQDEFDFQLPSRNNDFEITAQYADMEFGDRTECLKVKVIHDDLGPNILFSKYPAPTLEEGSKPELQYSITDSHPVAEAYCSMNGVEKPCPAGGPHDVDLTALPVGDYSFSIRAFDAAGNSSSKSVEWKVLASTRNLTQLFFLNDYRKVDILMVIDNSGSMEYEQRSMASRVRNFLSILRGLDWQIAVTTTDPRSTAVGGDGKLLPIYGRSNEYIFNSSMNENDAQYLLGMTMQRPETGSSSEQGINSTYRAIERSLVAGAPQAGLFRGGAQFATLLISDEDESANNFKNDPHNLVNFVSSTFGGQKSFSYHSIITRPGDTACRNTHGYAYGERYKVMSELTGGVIGSVCETDYGAQLQGIANGIRDLLKTLTLQCEPLRDRPIVVEVDGVPYTAPYTIEGVNLRFSSELPPGTFSVNYHCL